MFPESNERALAEGAARIMAALHEAGIEASTGWSLRDPRHDVVHAIHAADKQMYEQKRARRTAAATTGARLRESPLPLPEAPAGSPLHRTPAR